MKRRAKPKQGKKRAKQTLGKLLEQSNRETICELVDWLEVSAWAQPGKTISRQTVTSWFVLGSNNDEAEEKTNQLWSEIKTRAFALKTSYPFKLSGDEELFSFSGNDVASVPYIFCLLISYFGLPKIVPRRALHVSHLFEKLCTHAANKYVSDDLRTETKNYQFGWPRSDWARQYKSIDKAMNELLRQLGDGTNRLSGVRNLAGRGESTGDGGLDVVAWRLFPDGKKGMLVFLGQCATANDRTTDLLDLI